MLRTPTPKRFANLPSRRRRLRTWRLAAPLPMRKLHEVPKKIPSVLVSRFYGARRPSRPQLSVRIFLIFLVHSSDPPLVPMSRSISCGPERRTLRARVMCSQVSHDVFHIGDSHARCFIAASLLFPMVAGDPDSRAETPGQGAAAGASRLNEGTTFILRLPLTPADNETSSPARRE